MEKSFFFTLSFQCKISFARCTGHYEQ